MIALVVALVPATAMAQSDALQATAAEVAQQINQARAAQGLHALQFNPQLGQAAQTHVQDMAANANYSHTGSDGSSVRTRAARAGYPQKQPVSENWVAVSDPSGALQWWMNSSVHRNNILNGKWTAFGVGAQFDPRNGMTIFVVVFGGNGKVGSERSAAAVSGNTGISVAKPPANGQYTVRSGDTLLGIALRFGMTWQDLAAANGLGEQSLLQLGQILTFPGAKQSPAAGSGPAIDLQPYMVQQGDTLSTIAQRYGLTWQRLASLNNLSEKNVLQVGQMIQVPRAQSAAATGGGTGGATGAVPSAQSVNVQSTYTVQTGDTIIAIALRFDLNWQAILALNGLGDNDVLAVGQQIRLR